MVNEHEIDKIVDDINSDQAKTESIFGKLEVDLTAWWDEHFHSKSTAPVSPAAKTALNTIVSNAMMSAAAQPASILPQASSVSSIAGSSSIDTAVS